MTYREPAPGAAAPPPLVLPHVGAIGRVFISLVIGAAMAFLLGMAVWTTQDSFLDCRRAAGTSSPTCSNDKFYPFSIATHEQLPSFSAARIEERISRGRGGSQHHLVLVLDHEGATTTEFPGIGKNGVNAPVVAADINEFLGDDSRRSARWHLRESVYPLTALILALVVGMAVLAGVSFRRTMVAFDPASRVVTVRVGRWPLGANVWAAKIDDIDRVERTDSLDQYGPTYSVQLTARGSAPRGLGLGLRNPVGADEVLARVAERLASWRA